MHRAVGEGSVSYLYLPEAIERIRRINPAARFLALVRNPLPIGREAGGTQHDRSIVVAEDAIAMQLDELRHQAPDVVG